MVSKSVLIAGLAASLGQLVQATNTELPPCVDKFEPYKPVGCFSEADPSALIFRSSVDQNDMTVEKCTAICKGNGFRYAGLKYYGVCYCGSSVRSEKTDESQCNLPCSGDKSQTCGGDNALSVWEDPTFSQTPEEVSESDYAAQGCYTDSGSGRALTWPAEIDGSDLTPSKCIAACKEQGFAYAGTEYGGECYCGTFLAKDSSKTADSECNVPCRGDGSQSCGGPQRLNVYFAKRLLSSEPCGPKPPVSSSTIATTTTSSKPVDTTTSKPVDTTTTSKPVDTTTTSKPADTTTTSKPVDTTTTSKPVSTTTTSKPVVTTTPKPSTTNIPSTTTKPSGTTLTTSSVCVTTTVTPPKCERQIGNWCAPPVPEWNNKIECLLSAKTCALRTASCFIGAGIQNAIKCFEYAKYCESIKLCCLKCGLGKCSKGGCSACGGNPPSTPTTKTIPCTPTSTPTPTVCPPAPTNICKEAFPGKPLCDIPLPIVNCNDQKGDFDSNPFKLYDNVETSKCWKFPPHQVKSACSKACQEQYNSCVDAGLWQCAFKNKRNSVDSAAVAEVAANQSPNEDGLQPRTFNLVWQAKCKAQLAACLKVNALVDPKDKCKKWCPKDD